MSSNLKMRLLVILLVVVIGIWFLVPTIRLVYYQKIDRIELDKMSDMELKNLKKGTLNLGLDLKGGVDLVYSIDSAKMLDNLLWKNARFIKDKVDKQLNTDVMVNVDDKNKNIIFTVPNDLKSSDKKKMKAIVGSSGRGYFKMLPAEKAGTIVTHLSANGESYFVSDALDKALEVIRNRVDMFAVSEPVISRIGNDQLRVQLPGVSNVKEAIDIIGTTAQLQFRLVREDNGSVPDVDNIMQLPQPKSDEEIVYGVTDPDTGKTPVYVLKKNALLTGEYLTNASITFDPMTSRPMVSLTFDKEGAQKFYNITSKYTKRRLAIVLDDKVQSAPVIDEPIPSGSAVIKGNFSDEEAKKLSIVLRAGALPAPLRKDSEIMVGPTLGADSIKLGVTAIAIGLILVILYMIVYYKFSGVLADIALIMNIVLVLAILALLRGTLTLPGLAGLVLTVGMAVDANVIIFERIKEELRNGKTPRASIDTGFEKAFNAILDSNVTTIITALILYFFGTGPIKGFAVTLGLGVASSMFTALFVVRTLMELIISGKKKVISI
jgi:preprotein translocase subunit SecD